MMNTTTCTYKVGDDDLEAVRDLLEHAVGTARLMLEGEDVPAEIAEGNQYLARRLESVGEFDQTGTVDADLLENLIDQVIVDTPLSDHAPTYLRLLQALDPIRARRDQERFERGGMRTA